eukprot:1730815-Rhodomonas_salina.3
MNRAHIILDCAARAQDDQSALCDHSLPVLPSIPLKSHNTNSKTAAQYKCVYQFPFPVAT